MHTFVFPRAWVLPFMGEEGGLQEAILTQGLKLISSFPHSSDTCPVFLMLLLKSNWIRRTSTITKRAYLEGPRRHIAGQWDISIAETAIQMNLCSILKQNRAQFKISIYRVFFEGPFAKSVFLHLISLCQFRHFSMQSHVST